MNTVASKAATERMATAALAWLDLWFATVYAVTG